MNDVYWEFGCINIHLHTVLTKNPIRCGYSLYSPVSSSVYWTGTVMLAQSALGSVSLVECTVYMQD